MLAMRLCNVGSCHDCIFAAAGSGASGGSALDASLFYPTSLVASLIHTPSLAIVCMHSHAKVQVYRYAKRFNRVRRGCIARESKKTMVRRPRRTF